MDGRDEPDHDTMAWQDRRRSRFVVTVRLRLAPTALELAALTDLGRHVVDLAQRRLEGVAQCQPQFLRGVTAAGTLMADDDRAASRHADLDLDLEGLRPLRVA